jgi:hypothetical protein
MAQEDDVAATKRTLGKACMECDVERDRAEAIRQDYQARLHASTASRRRFLDFDRVLSGCQFILSVREMDLEWREERLDEE